MALDFLFSYGYLFSLPQLDGDSIGLGFAGPVNQNGKETLDRYIGALYFAIGLGVAALIIDILVVRVPKYDGRLGRRGYCLDECQ